MWSQADAVPSRERLERQSDRWRLGVLHTVQYRCVRTILEEDDHESRVKRAELSVCQKVSLVPNVSLPKSPKVQRCRISLHTKRSCHYVPNNVQRRARPQHCNLRTTAVANIDTICKAQAIAQPFWPIAQITHDARCTTQHITTRRKREQRPVVLAKSTTRSNPKSLPPRSAVCGLAPRTVSKARNASALKWDTHLPAHVSWLEAWPEAEKQPSHATEVRLRRRSPAALPAEL
jgi:hypothetical protein